jgi:NAD(P)-dependent dehydrogenase (short-subunit alcohol dehydrogenase family)
MPAFKSMEGLRVAIVTGGASGIGLSIVRHLVSEGVRVIAVDRDRGACEAARDGFLKAGEPVEVVVADIGTEQGAAAAIAAAMDRFGRIDILCNNAAVHPLALIEEHDLESWQETFRVNVDGTMLCSRAALPHMKKLQGGTIVNIGSVSGVSPYSGGGAYAASKAAVAMLTRVLALEAGPFGITVNCIAPGAIRHNPPGPDEAPPTHIPVGRTGTPDDVAQLVSFLASSAARYLNGAVIVLDGGATAGRSRASRPSGNRT